MFILGCSKDDEIKTLEGTQWKCVGFVDGQSGTIKEIEPKESNTNYVISFHTNDSLSGKSSNNDLVGIYSVDFHTMDFRIIKLGGTKMGEIGDGELYCERLKATQGFSVTKQELKLYYNGNNDYLLYNQKN